MFSSEAIVRFKKKKRFRQETKFSWCSDAKPFTSICVLLDLCFPYFCLVLRILTPIFFHNKQTISEKLFTPHYTSSGYTSKARTYIWNHACVHTHAIIYSRKFTSEKNFVKSDRQAVQKRPSGSWLGIYFRQTAVSFQSFDRRSFDCRIFLRFHGTTRSFTAKRFSRSSGA